MIESLVGTVVAIKLPSVLFQVGPVTLSIPVSAHTARGLQPGKSLTLYTYLHITAESMTLYGFADQDERALFLELMKVQGLGARSILKILSRSTPSAVADLIAKEDPSQLQRIPGIGKKTAERILFSLRGTLPKFSSLKTESIDEGQDQFTQDLVAALVEMGFDRKAVDAQIEAPLSSGRQQGLDDEPLIQHVLSHMLQVLT